LRWTVFGGLEGWEGSGLWLDLRFSLVLFEDLFDQEGDAAFAFGGLADFGGWGEDA
jgi:hypothetical protein